MIRRLDEASLVAFLDYCRKHRHTLDKSYLTDAELEKFRSKPVDPTFIALDEDMKVRGAASLVIDEAALRASRARLRILHSETDDHGSYKALMEGLINKTSGINSFYVFSPDTNLSLLGNLNALGFKIDRVVFLLIKDYGPNLEVNLPAGFGIRRYIAGSDEQAWSDIRNSAFAALKGNESPIAANMVREMAAGDDSIDGGMLFLTDGGKPVGLVRGSEDEYGGCTVINIGPLAVLPSYQGNGHGKALLRAMLNCAYEKSYKNVILSVNADNESALSLYLKEGFVKAEGFACLSIAV